MTQDFLFLKNVKTLKMPTESQLTFKSDLRLLQPNFWLQSFVVVPSVSPFFSSFQTLFTLLFHFMASYTYGLNKASSSGKYFATATSRKQIAWSSFQHTRQSINLQDIINMMRKRHIINIIKPNIYMASILSSHDN